MATFENCRSISRVAAVDLSALLYHFAVLDSSGNATSGGTTLTAQGVVDGIVGEAAVAGKAISLVVPDGGIAKVVCAGAITAGALVATDAAGFAIALGAGNGNLAWGRALETGAASRVIEIHFMFMGQVNA